MRLFVRGFLGVLFILLVACTVGPDFIQPKAPITASYSREGDFKKIGEQRIVYSPSMTTLWWSVFRNDALNSLVQLGLKNNYDLIAARETLQQAKEKFYAQKGKLWPELSLNAGVGRQQYGVALFGSTDNIGPPFTYYEIGPTLNMPIDVFGGVRRSVEKQRALTAYQQEIARATALSMVGSISATALQIAAINEQIATTQHIIHEDEQNTKLVQTAFRLGSATQTEVLSAKAQQENDETLLPPLYQQLSVAQDTLSVLLGTPPANWQPPNFKLKDFVLPKNLPLILPSTLVHKRPDILAAEAMLHAANADIGIATAHLYPIINLSTALTQEALSPRNLFQYSANAWNMVGSLTALILDGGTLRAERRAAVHAYQAAYANYQQVVIKAFSQVNDALHALQHDEQAMQKEKQALATAKKSLDLARLSYQAGNVGLLQILDAERLYAKSKLSYAQVEAQRYQDTIRFYLALGN